MTLVVNSVVHPPPFFGGKNLFVKALKILLYDLASLKKDLPLLSTNGKVEHHPSGERTSVK